jgi:hypothetical protein
MKGQTVENLARFVARERLPGAFVIGRFSNTDQNSDIFFAFHVVSLTFSINCPSLIFCFCQPMVCSDASTLLTGSVMTMILLGLVALCPSLLP